MPAQRPLGPVVTVDDPADDRLAPYRCLNDPAFRRRVDHDESIFVVEGRVSVRQLLGSNYEMLSLFVDDHQVTGAADLVEAVRSRGVPTYVGRRDVMAATVGFDLHRGVVAVARRPPPADARDVIAEAIRTTNVNGGPPIIAVLEGLNDAENIGAVFRNAAAFGVAAVLLDPTCADPLYRRSVRVSVGHVLHVPFARLAAWPDDLGALRAAGCVVAALAPRPRGDGGGPQSASLAELVTSWTCPSGLTGVAVLLGAEGPGLSDQALGQSDVVVSIPMTPNVDSVNVATAGAIAFNTLSTWEGPQ